MKVEVFEMERFQSIWENRVTHNLSESGVHPMSLGELLDPKEREAIFDQRFIYVQTNGTPELRASIAALYPGATPDNIVVGNGTAEANYITVWRLVEPGDEVVMMLPNYMQIWGVVRGQGATVVPWRLREERRWEADVDELASLVTPRTKLIVVCNPNNPTGSILSEAARRAIVGIAEKAGAWILADEVYRGSELDGRETTSFWGLSDRVLVACGMSKACGLPGLRIGWVAGPAPMVAELWARKDYLSIAPASLSDRLAQIALRPDVRPRILARTRGLINANLHALTEWMRGHEPGFRLVPPRAGAIAYPRYSWPINSTRLMERLRDEQSVLVVPGDQFGMDGYLRIGLGNEPGELKAGLARMDSVLESLGPPPGFKALKDNS
jgi:aspartate/methionine/tyrosine aminotransferase